MQNKPLNNAQIAAAAEALTHAEASIAANKAETRRQAELIERGKTPLLLTLVWAAIFFGCVYAYTQNWHISTLGFLAGAVAANAYIFAVRAVKLHRATKSSRNAT